MKPKLLFLDRDGTLIEEPEDQQIDHLDKLRFLPGVIRYLGQIVRELDYRLVMVTNQDGLGTSRFPEADFWPVHNLIMRTLEGEGIVFDEVLIDRSLPEEQAPTRKPGTALLKHYQQGHYDLANSFVIGDRLSDVQLAQNLGTRSIGLGPAAEAADFGAADWADLYRSLHGLPRQARVQRTTKETTIEVRLLLEGSGQCNNHTGLGFFDHMLDQLAFHGGFDLSVRVSGDLHVDEHHTIEDTALALGQALDQALGTRKDLSRYGFVLPMDESRATVALDLGGRRWLAWEADFRREKIGDMPTEMFRHFFHSVADAARMTLHIEAQGENEHHMIEAIFKGFARALKAAVRREAGLGIPSTKGSI